MKKQVAYIETFVFLITKIYKPCEKTKNSEQFAIDIGIFIQNKTVAHYTSQAKYGGLYLYHKN